MEKATKMKSDKLMEIVRSKNVYSKVVWNGVTLNIQHTLSLPEMMNFVDAVSKLCFAEDTGAYIPEVKDFGIKTYILEMYAGIEMPKSTNDMYDLLYRTDIVYTIIDNINKVQLDEIVTAIDNKIKHLSDAKVDAITKQMSELYSAFDNLEKQLENIFSGISHDDMSKIVGALSNGKFDEGKLVSAYLEGKYK